MRGGYLQNGTQFIKSAGPTFYANNYKNAAAGGSNMFTGTTTGSVTGTFRMNNLRVVEQNGSNNAPFFLCGRMNCSVDDPIFDYIKDAVGANASLGVAFGYIKNPSAVKVNLVIIDPNVPNIGTITGAADFNASASTTSLSSATNGKDLFIQKLDVYGNFIWAKKIGGASAQILGSKIKLYDTQDKSLK